jgi:hypothetical protein
MGQADLKQPDFPTPFFPAAAVLLCRRADTAPHQAAIQGPVPSTWYAELCTAVASCSGSSVAAYIHQPIAALPDCQQACMCMFLYRAAAASVLSTKRDKTILYGRTLPPVWLAAAAAGAAAADVATAVRRPELISSNGLYGAPPSSVSNAPS